jgi:phage terminase large subunit
MTEVKKKVGRPPKKNDNRDIPITVNFDRLMDSKNERTILLVGSTRSGKSFSIMQYLIVRAMSESKFIFIGRHDGTRCSNTVIKDFKEILTTQFKTFNQSSWNSRDKIYTFPNGSVFRFGGTQDILKLHGQKQDITWLNEANEVQYEAYVQLLYRTTEQMIMDMNPSDADSWVLTRIKNQEDTVYIHSTYKDNPFLTKAQIQGIEQFNPDIIENVRNGTADKYKWEVYGLGLPSAREGVVIPASNWMSVPNNEFPRDEQCDRVLYGLDFGISSDPNALVKIQIYNRQLWLTELLYETGLPIGRLIDSPHTSSLVDRIELAGLKKSDLIVCDSARPDSIKTLQLSGYRAIPCKKYNGSIVEGIKLLTSYFFNVNERSSNLKSELRNYIWLVNPSNGQVTDKPIDKYNHLIDAVRMAVQTILGGAPDSTGVFDNKQKAPKAQISKLRIARRW